MVRKGEELSALLNTAYSRAEKRDEAKPYFAFLRLLLSALLKLPRYEQSVWRGVKKDLSALYREDVQVYLVGIK